LQKGIAHFLNTKDMERGKDIFRNASLFTMNGMVDPRLMPGYSKNTASTTGNEIKKASVLMRIRFAMHYFVGKLITK
jgi:hypothetical protein